MLIRCRDWVIVEPLWEVWRWHLVAALNEECLWIGVSGLRRRWGVFTVLSFFSIIRTLD